MSINLAQFLLGGLIGLPFAAIGIRRRWSIWRTIGTSWLVVLHLFAVAAVLSLLSESAK